MPKLDEIFTKENANWLAPTITVLASLGIFSLFGKGLSIGSLVGALGMGGMALITSQAVTGTGLFKPDTILGDIAENVKDKVGNAISLKPSKPGPRFDHLLVDLVKDNDGVFLGENHSKPMVVQSLTKLIPILKANGMGTIGVERTEEQMLFYETVAKMMDGDIVFENRDEAIKGIQLLSSLTSKEVAMINLIRDAKKAGVKVIGYEMPREQLSPRIKAIHNRINADGQVTYEELHFLEYEAVQVAVSAEGMRHRDKYSAEYIQKHKEGKIVLIGGEAHSGDFSAVDAIFNLEETHGDIKNYSGLNERLNYPAVDFEQATPEHPIGTTEIVDGRFADYKVYLNSDMEDLQITSWPPRPGQTRDMPKHLQNVMPKENREPISEDLAPFLAGEDIDREKLLEVLGVTDVSEGSLPGSAGDTPLVPDENKPNKVQASGPAPQ